jgi:hypothetical protein
MSKPSDVREISREDIHAYVKAKEDLQAMKDAYLGLRAELSTMEETIWGLDPQWNPDAPSEELKSIEEKLPALKEHESAKRGYLETLIAKPLVSSIIKKLAPRGTLDPAEGEDGRLGTCSMAEK